MQVGDKVLLCVSNDTWTSEMVAFSNEVVTLRSIRANMFTISESSTLIFTLEDVIEKVGEAPVGNQQDVFKIAAEVYGEENVDVFSISGGFQLTIRFNEINLTNSLNQEHKINDLYVAIQITNVNILNDTKGRVVLSGRRGTVSHKEWISSYSHSHLSSSYSEYQTFCLGTSDIAMLINELQLSFQKDMWYMLFYALPNYVNWESLEGGPYKRIGELKNGSSNKDELETLLIQIVKNIPYSIFDHSDKLSFIETHPDLINFYNEYSVIKTSELNKHDCEEISRNITISFKFKDEIIKLKVVKEDKQEQSFVSKDVIDEYNDILQEKINKFNDTYQQTKYNEQFTEQIFGEDYVIQ